MAATEANGSDESWLNFSREGLREENPQKFIDSAETKKSRAKESKHQNGTDASAQAKRPAFESKDRSHIQLQTQLPDELWLAVLESPCTFPNEIYHTVMLNLIKNPNITSSHLFRADIFYDSENDHLFRPEEDPDPYQSFAKHMKEEYRPRLARWPGFQLERTIVRQLVPRNPQLDKPLVQTCHFFRRQDSGDQEESLVVYIPHVEKPEEVPFYHPTVSQLAFLHTWRPSHADPPNHPSTLTLLYRSFDSLPISTKLERTALKLLQTIHKHGQGQLLGYEKRVHHDQIIPQKRYQDTYTRLKAKYGRQISEKWVEVTDPGKHVFEDLGIAAFLIELWRDMYELPPGTSAGAEEEEEQQNENSDGRKKPPFPGFIDIGCGNGILVHILLSENFSPGSGFDARERKTWSIFPESVRSKLERKILVPEIFSSSSSSSSSDFVTGTLPKGIFIISNHADELTPWTPLLASLNASAFIAIPCCSHDLSGARFRAPPTTTTAKNASSSSSPSTRLPQQHTREECKQQQQAPETGSLQQQQQKKIMPSAYSTLCSYIASLAVEVGFEPETEILRIPSTRNTCIIGRRRQKPMEKEVEGEDEEKLRIVTALVERELKRDVEVVGREWVGRAERLMGKPGSGH